MSFNAYETSSAQKRLYIIDYLLGNSLLYNENRVWNIEGKLDPILLKRTLEQLSLRHEILRTCFIMKDGEVLQKVYDRIDVDFTYTQKETVDPTPKDIEVLIDHFLKPYDLADTPLWKVRLVQWQGNRQSILIDFHHIIADGISMDLFMRELGAFYLGKELPEPKVQYVDFTIWQNDILKSEKICMQEAYWLKVFEGDIPLLELPMDFSRPREANIAGSSVDFELAEDITAGVNKLAARYNTSLYVVLLTVFDILLAKYTNQEDIVVGTPVSGRSHREFENIIGMFVNTLAMRNRPEFSKTFNEFLSEVSRNAFAAFENQDYQFEMLVEKVTLDRQMNRNPLFDVMFALQNFSQDIDLSAGGNEDMRIIPYHYKRRAAKFDLTLQAFEEGRHILFMLDYRTCLFRPETIARLIKHFLNIFHEVTENPEVLLSNIQVISESEREQLLYVFNDTAVEFPVDKTIPQLFEEQVKMSPDHIALVGAAPRGCPVCCPVQLTYRELAENAGRMACVLNEKGIRADNIVGIMVDRSIDTIKGILSILKSGGAYLPIDPDYPQERIDYMLKDSNAKILINISEIRNPKFETNPNDQTINVQNKNFEDLMVLNFEFLHFEFVSNFAIRASNFNSSNLAYIIYTSGSTGRPKGVMVEHRNVVNLVYGLKERIYSKYSRNLEVALVAPFIFDASVKQVFGALLLGYSLYIVPGDTRFDGEKLYEYYMKYAIDISDGTPTHLRLLLESRGGKNLQLNIRRFLIGGEPLTWNIVEKLFAHFETHLLKFTNVYGPTECCVDSATYEISKKNIGSHSNPPIGAPMPNQQVYIVSKVDNLQPIGVPGELCIGGNSVSRGYLNKPELTAERFKRNVISQSSFVISSPSNLPNDQCPMTNDRFYKTGDLVRWLVDGPPAGGAIKGVIEFLGRIDQQVKIRGFRIELGEIEAELLKHELVKEAVVIDRKEESGEKYLCCYIVSKQDFNLAGLKEYLAGRLPDYMIPAYFMGIESIPLTSNGKLERKALPEPELKSSQEYEAPANELEVKLVGVWSEVLALEKEKIGINDNFFQLGGHSLKATILTAKIHKLFDVKIPLTQIFLQPTVKELGQYIKESVEDKYASVEPVEKKEYYVLSSAQQRLYILQQMDAGGTGYHVPYAYVLEGELDIMRLDTIFRKLIRRHESLRTSFIVVNEEPVQRIHDQVEFNIEYYDSTADERCSGQTRIIRSFIRPFDLSCAPLLRVGVIKKAETRHILALDIHHIVTDGASMELLRNEFTVFYGGGELPPLQVQYKDYACRQNSEEQKEASRKQEIYWLRQFEEEAPALELPLDYPRPAAQSFEGAAIAFEIPAPAAKRLNELAAKEGGTLYMVLLAVTTIFLAKIANQEDILVGSPVAGRGHVDLEGIMGMFVNTLVMRNYPVGGKRFSTFLEEVKQGALDVFENQDYQFEDLVGQVMVKRDPGRNPLFDVTFALQNMQVQPGDTTKTEIFELGVKPYDMETRTAKFDISLSCLEGHDGLLFTLEYCTKLFKKETIRRFIDYYKNVISAVIERPDREIADIEILTEAEKLRILDEFNETEASYPTDKTIHELFENQVERIPDQSALAGAAPRGCPITGQNQLSYRELKEQSDRLARLLLEKGVLADSIVGLMMDRSIETIIGILGILKSGGAYLPMDPDYPQERIDYMLKDSNAKILITKSEIRNPKFETTPNDQKINVQNKNFEDLMVLNFENLNFEFVSNFAIRASNFNSSNLAYIIYTSGSTGRPKGVMVEHRNVVNLVYGLKERIYSKYSRNLEVALVAPFIFDASVKQVFGALLLGYSLYIVPEDVRFDGEKLYEYYMKYAIDISDGTPTHLRLLLESRGGKNLQLNIRRFLIGGEPLTWNIVEKLFAHFETHLLKFTNVYGPTECCVDSATYEISKKNIGSHSNPPIGAPMPNQQVYIVSKVDNLQPIGVPGELCIGGNSVSRGYLNKPELTAEKFIDYHHSSFIIHHSKLYRTGDLARWLPDGNIEFLGRMDHQVKLRGFRIETGEIENLLLNHNKIKEAVVLAKEDERGDAYICAYVVGTDGAAFDKMTSMELAKELKEYLSGMLPDYMIPSFFVLLETIPVTSQGKVDRKSLPEPGKRSTAVYTVPRDAMDEKLVEIWGEVLNIIRRKDLGDRAEGISIDDNFFELGGHSLRAAVLIARIHKELEVVVKMADIFKMPTIRGISDYLRGAVKDVLIPIEPVEKKEYYPLSPAQNRLYLLHQIDPGSTVYHIPLMLPLEGKADIEKLEEASRGLIIRHESLRTSFHLIGDEPVQRIHDEVEFKIEILGAGIDFFIRPFDLSHAPLCRVGLIKALEDKYILVVDMHHIITDGISHDILAREFTALYAGEELPFLRLQYKDYAEWENSDTRKETRKKQEAYWLKEFTGEIPLLRLPMDHARPEVFGFRGDKFTIMINPGVTAEIKKLAGQMKVTLMMFMFSVYKILLSKYSGQEEFVVGTVSAGRRHADLENIIGFFVNMLAIKTRPAMNKTFREYLMEVKEKALNAYENQDYPFEELVDRLGIRRQPGRQPLVDTVFAFYEENRSGPQESQARQAAAGASHFDLMIYITARNDSMSAIFEFSTDLFNKSTIEEFSNSYREILAQVVENLDITLKEIKITLPHHLMAARSAFIRDDEDAWEW